MSGTCDPLLFFFSLFLISHHAGKLFLSIIGMIMRITVSISREMFFFLSRAWDKEKILSPHEESNLRPSDLRSDALPLSHKDTSMSEVYYEVLMTRVLHTARISNVDSVMFVNRLREMVSFELGKEIEKDVFRLVISCRYHLLLQFPVFKI